MDDEMLKAISPVFDIEHTRLPQRFQFLLYVALGVMHSLREVGGGGTRVRARDEVQENLRPRADAEGTPKTKTDNRGSAKVIETFL
ncbi:MAG TPA: hypothetical protein VNL35_13005 [Chloroflexota bacterium]|nr:hypothetical protein [Chloroflexota bacterium]